MSNIMQVLSDAHINPFGAVLICESLLKSPIARQLVERNEPLAIDFPIQRGDCAGWLGVQMVLMPIADNDDPTVPDSAKLTVRQLLAKAAKDPDQIALFHDGSDLVDSKGRPVIAVLKGRAAIDVLSERLRQVHEKGWSTQHDDEHNPGELAAAASAYALAAADKLCPYSQGDGDFDSTPPLMWPAWDTSWWKPGTPRRMLEKAGALILAELERMDRVAAAPVSVAQPGAVDA